MVRTRALCALVVILASAAAACASTKPALAPGQKPHANSAAEARADAALLPDKLLPDHWRQVPADDYLGEDGRPSYCGISAVPHGVVEGRIAAYDEGRGLGRYVIEWAMLSTVENGKKTMAALAKHRDDCREAPEEKLTVQPVEVKVGEESLGWDYGPQDRAFRVLIFRRGDTMVVLAATGPGANPDQEQLSIARKIDARLVEAR